PVAALEALRTECWVVRTPIGGLVIGRSEVQALLADRHLRSSVPDFVRLQGITEGELYDELAYSIIALEGDEHTRIRKLVNRAFTPRAIDTHRDDMRATLLRLVDPIRGAGRCDFMADIAEHYPIEVMCHLLGVPDVDHEDFARWNRAITWALSFQLGAHLDDVTWGMSAMKDYVSGLMTERRREPQDDLVSALVLAREADDRLSDAEVLRMIGSLLFAGYDTTRNQLGLAMWLFAEHPEQWNLLRADPTLAAQAVEEAMRFRGAVSVAPRMVASELEFQGFRFEANTMLNLSTSSANHDPSAFDEPWTFDITANREAHFTFGGGPHYCLGASLARAEMQEALPILAQAMPELALDGETTWRPPFGIFGPESLPIRFAAS
ncbi:MAG TPA: cytochrome P450, partial [Acidimicrobiales bacterium]|nr:cytochrome P450 [Acidimicrobiales bacterium]